MYPAMDLTAGEKSAARSKRFSAARCRARILSSENSSWCSRLRSPPRSSPSFRCRLPSVRETAPSWGREPGGGRRAANHDHFESDRLHLFRGACRLPCFRGPPRPSRSSQRVTKEAQSYISPLMIVMVMPAVAALPARRRVDATLALVPVLNTSLVSREIIAGTYHWSLIAVIFVVQRLRGAGAGHRGEAVPRGRRAVQDLKEHYKEEQRGKEARKGNVQHKRRFILCLRLPASCLRTSGPAWRARDVLPRRSRAADGLAQSHCELRDGLEALDRRGWQAVAPGDRSSGVPENSRQRVVHFVPKEFRRNPRPIHLLKAAPLRPRARRCARGGQASPPRSAGTGSPAPQNPPRRR